MTDKTPSESPGTPQKIRENDPYPKMITVCIAITVVLFFVIMGVIFYDFVESDAFLPGAPGDQGTTPGFPPVPGPENAPPTE